MTVLDKQISMKLLQMEAQIKTGWISREFAMLMLGWKTTRFSEFEKEERELEKLGKERSIRRRGKNYNFQDLKKYKATLK